MKKHIKEIINGNPFYHGTFLAVLLALYFLISGIMGWKSEADYPLFFVVGLRIWLFDLVYLVSYWIIYRLIIRQWILKKP